MGGCGGGGGGWWGARGEGGGGIKAHSRRGSFGRTWWARRWLDVLESLDLGGRLSRGRAYARRGQVLDITVEEGCVTASVQGSRKDPYAVTIRVDPLPAAVWRKVARVLGREARFAAKLLASEMPEDVEEAFTRAGASLLPSSRSELRTECSCPDWSNPCKHIAAVHYLLGEEFDRDPFLIFRMRGLTREGLQALLEAESRHQGRGPAAGAIVTADAGPSEAAEEPEPVIASSDDPQGSLDTFWSGGELPPADEVRVPDPPPAVLARLGPFPFWRGREPIAAALEGAYLRASLRAVDVYVGLSATRIA
jgi:uncharacterized Zn finger protein